MEALPRAVFTLRAFGPDKLMSSSSDWHSGGLLTLRVFALAFELGCEFVAARTAHSDPPEKHINIDTGFF